MTKKEAIQIIINDTKNHGMSLNHAIDYCWASLRMPENSEAFKAQIPYILYNITHWRHPKAKEIRKTLRKSS